MKVYLHADEWKLIKRRCAEKEATRKAEACRMSVAKTAAQFFRYLDQAGMAHSFFECIKGFGHKEEIEKRAYEYVPQARGGFGNEALD